MLPFSGSAFTTGMTLSLSLIIAIGPQNAHLLRLGLQREHLWISVAVCALADVVLITIGVLGLAQVEHLPDRLYGAMIGAAVVVLLIYGWQAATRFWQNRKISIDSPHSVANPAKLTRKQAIYNALAFSWLNPHAWIDTTILIGAASLAFQADARTGFGLGAITGSIIWFVSFGALAAWLGRRLGQTSAWRWVDGLVALMMWSIAMTLAWGLIR